MVGRFVLRNVMKWLSPRVYKYFLKQGPYGKVIEYQKHFGNISQLRAKWVHYWREKKLDFVICPGFGCQAFPHGKSERLGLTAGYTLVWNVLDMTVCAMPVTLVREDEQNYPSKFNDMLAKEIKEVARGSEGMPAGVQVVAMPY